MRAVETLALSPTARKTASPSPGKLWQPKTTTTYHGKAESKVVPWQTMRSYSFGEFRTKVISICIMQALPELRNLRYRKYLKTNRGSGSGRRSSSSPWTWLIHFWWTAGRFWGSFGAIIRFSLVNAHKEYPNFGTSECIWGAIRQTFWAVCFEERQRNNHSNNQSISQLVGKLITLINSHAKLTNLRTQLIKFN